MLYEAPSPNAGLHLSPTSSPNTGKYFLRGGRLECSLWIEIEMLWDSTQRSSSINETALVGNSNSNNNTITCKTDTLKQAFFCWEAFFSSCATSTPLMGRLHGSYSAYELPYDFLHDLHKRDWSFDYLQDANYNCLETHFRKNGLNN
jgi:hypothetical protein